VRCKDLLNEWGLDHDGTYGVCRLLLHEEEGGAALLVRKWHNNTSYHGMIQFSSRSQQRTQENGAAT